MKNRLHIFATLPFVLCLGLLIVNDFYWKYAFHNALTGKLSDFTGLFVFPIFWAAFFPKFRKGIYWGTGLFFIFWKSPASEGFIEIWNQWCFLGIGRVVDYSDLWALLSLPVAYWYEDFYWKRKPLEVKIHPAFIATLSFWAFTATSPQRPDWQKFERPVTLVFQVDSADVCEMKECCEMIKKEHLYPNYENYTSPNFKDYFIVDSLLTVQIEGAFVDHTRQPYGGHSPSPFTTDTAKEKQGKKILLFTQFRYPVQLTQIQHLPYYHHCSDIYIHQVTDSLELTGNLSNEHQKLHFFNSLQHGKQTYFYENGKPRLIAHFTAGLEDGKWTYFSDSEIITKIEIWQEGILQQTDFYERGQIVRTESTATIFTAKSLTGFLWFVLILLTLYAAYRLWEVSTLKRIKWIFAGEGRGTIVLQIFAQFLVALLTTGLMVIFSLAIYSFIAKYYYESFGFQMGGGGEFPLIPFYIFLTFFIPTFMYLLLEHTQKEWIRWFLLLIACNLLLYQSFIFWKLGA